MAVLTPVIIKAYLDDGQVECITVNLAEKLKTVSEQKSAIGSYMLDISKNGIFIFHKETIQLILPHRIQFLKATLPTVILAGDGRPQ